MNQQQDRLVVVTRRSLTWFYFVVGSFGLVFVASMVPVALSGAGCWEKVQHDRFMQILDSMRGGPWIAPVLFGLVAINFAFLIRYLTPRRRELILEGNAVIVDGRTYLPPDVPQRPCKWTHSYAGTVGTALELRDPAGAGHFVGLRNLLLPDHQYGPRTVEDCDFYFDDKKSGARFIDRMASAGVVELAEDSARLEDPFYDAADPGPLVLTLNVSPSQVRTWLPLGIGFFVCIYAIVGFGMGLRKFFHVPDGVIYILTLLGAVALIVGTVVYGTKRLRRRDIRLEIDSEMLTVRVADGKILHQRRIGELTFETPAWTAASRHAGSYYVGPQLQVLAGHKKLFRLGALDPDCRWSSPSKNVSTCDYLLGPPEWRKVVKRLGLADRLLESADPQQDS